ncbi:unnamed protein product [Protopolystoma xenopodis]|uniref:Uncharacterized protein n=1 Tax=Protopolystoma xenopodis TaxID=117903 RepID=A0A3S5BZU6_9PLAT|nr:unnamed protein product [Protopolystoma xenopodis]
MERRIRAGSVGMAISGWCKCDNLDGALGCESCKRGRSRATLWLCRSRSGESVPAGVDRGFVDPTAWSSQTGVNVNGRYSEHESSLPVETYGGVYVRGQSGLEGLSLKSHLSRSQVTVREPDRRASIGHSRCRDDVCTGDYRPLAKLLKAPVCI